MLEEVVRNVCLASAAYYGAAIIVSIAAQFWAIVN